jgi:putative oxidoreductase
MLAHRLPTSVRDAALLVARLVLGVVLVRHGWQKVSEFGLAGTSAGFDQMGVPAPGAAATFAAVAELGGGILLILGLLVPVAALLVVLDMVGAFVLVHLGLEPLVTENGWELVGAIAVGALLIGVLGAGRFSADHAVFGRRTTASVTETETVDA